MAHLEFIHRSRIESISPSSSVTTTALIHLVFICHRFLTESFTPVSATAPVTILTTLLLVITTLNQLHPLHPMNLLGVLGRELWLKEVVVVVVVMADIAIPMTILNPAALAPVPPPARMEEVMTVTVMTVTVRVGTAAADRVGAAVQVATLDVTRLLVVMNPLASTVPTIPANIPSLMLATESCPLIGLNVF
jgi:hypothetical protein